MTPEKAMLILEGIVTMTPTVVKLASYKRRKLLRLEYRTETKQQFRDACAEVFGKKAVMDKTVHHMLPISLGGSNSFCNLALLPEALHKACHVVIDDQTRGLDVGGKMTILLPFFNYSVVQRGKSGKRYIGLASDELRIA